MSRLTIVAVVVAVLVGLGAFAQFKMDRGAELLGPNKHVEFNPDDITYSPGPPSLPEGSEMAVLEGDPSKEGIFVFRLRFPDGYQIPPHWHPNYERLTVLSGTLLLGMGEQFDEDAAKTYETGAFTVMPPEMRHYAVAEGETVIQLTSYGPWEITYVNPDDDPRL